MRAHNGYLQKQHSTRTASSIRSLAPLRCCASACWWRWRRAPS